MYGRCTEPCTDASESKFCLDSEMKTPLTVGIRWINARLYLLCKPYSAAAASEVPDHHPSIHQPLCRRSAVVGLDQSVRKASVHRFQSHQSILPLFSLKQSADRRRLHSSFNQSLLGLSLLSCETSTFRGFASRGYARAAGTSNNVDNATITPGQDSAAAGASDAANWPELLTNALNFASGVAKHTWERSLDAIQGVFDSSSTGPIDSFVSATVAVTVYACVWLILPRVLRALHRYVEQGPTARLLGRTPQEQMPYEMSMWSALEDPARLFVTLVAFSQLGAMVAPSTVAIHYLGQIWHGGIVVSMVWFLHRWKSSAFTRVLTGRKMTEVERERYLALDKFSSVGLVILGAMALAEASGIAVQSVLTVGGIGGVATAFAARDILGNALSGLALQFSKPFSVGDSISAGSIEGQVMEMGLHSTRLLNADKFPIIVPNSFFSSQVIINKSRAQWRGLNAKFPVHLSSIEKLREITKEILEKLREDPNVFLEYEPPRCYVSTIGPAFVELVVSCNIKPMGKDGFLLVQQELLISIAQILTRQGAALGAFQSQ